MIWLTTFAPHSGRTAWIVTDRGMLHDAVAVTDPNGLIRIGEIDSVEFRRREFRRLRFFRRHRTERRVRVSYRFETIG